MAGFRVNSIDLDVSLAPGLLTSQRFGMSETWVDPLNGAFLIRLLLCPLTAFFHPSIWWGDLSVRRVRLGCGGAAHLSP